MRVVIADDDPVVRLQVKALLSKDGHQVIEAADGVQALQVLKEGDAPHLAILVWMMDGMDGPEVCRQVRADAKLRSVYLLLLTSRGGRKYLLEGLSAGANDYLTKPFDPEELQARVNVGVRMLQLQTELAERIEQLEEALANVRQLQRLLPICSYCKKIRDDKDYWHQVDHYIAEHSETRFSHGICPDCWKNIVEPELAKPRPPPPRPPN